MSSTHTTPELLELELERIVPAPDNPRRDLGDLAELAASIKDVGVLEPLTVTDGDGSTYIAVFGHRRLAAAKLAGVKTAPAIVRHYEDVERVEVMMAENLQRADLNPVDEARGYARLRELGRSQKQIARAVGRAESHVSKRLALLELPAPALELVGSGGLPVGDGLELVKFAKEPDVIARVLTDVQAERKRGGTFAPGNVARHAERIAQDLAAERKRTEARNRLMGAGVRILEPNRAYSAGVVQLGKSYGELPMGATEHGKQPCHAALVDWNGDVRYFCTKLANHAKDPELAKKVRELTSTGGRHDDADARAAEAKAAAAKTRERNKQLRARQPIRAEYLEAAMKAARGKRANRERILDFTLRQLVQLAAFSVPRRAEEHAGALLGLKRNGRAERVDWAPALKGKDGLLHVAYALALAMGEYPMRGVLDVGRFDEEYSSHAARLLEHLREASGGAYVADRTEAALLKPANRYAWRPAFDKAAK